VHVASPAPALGVGAAKKLPLAIPTDQVTDTVRETVGDVKKAPETIAAVKTCLGRLDQIKVGVEIMDPTPDQKDLITELIKKLPEPLRVIGEKTCS
jgi:hypothetical protein